MSHLATEAEADREYAINVGRDNPGQAWILSDRDAWYRNPFYTGPAVPHPEDDSALYDQGDYGPANHAGDDESAALAGGSL